MLRRSLFILTLIICAQTFAQNKLPAPVINDEIAITQKSIAVLDSRMSYIETGEGNVVLFLHGNPTSSFLWRNIIPFVSETHRAIAPDLIGMGNSGKPESSYSFNEHYKYLEAFIAKMKLKNITLVIHDWGAALGFEYALNHPDNVKHIAFMEGVLPPIFPQPSFEAMGEEMGGMFRAFKDPVQGKELVIDNNMFIEQVLPGFVNRPLSKKALDVYRAPYLKPEDRAPVLAWPRNIPIEGQPQENVQAMQRIETFMKTSEIPMLLLYTKPGVLINDQVLDWYTSNIKNIETNFVGQGFHFIQEDQPEAIGRAIRDWLRRN